MSTLIAHSLPSQINGSARVLMLQSGLIVYVDICCSFYILKRANFKRTLYIYMFKLSIPNQHVRMLNDERSLQSKSLTIFPLPC